MVSKPDNIYLFIIPVLITVSITLSSCVPEVPTSNEFDPVSENFRLPPPSNLNIRNLGSELFFQWKFEPNIAVEGFQIKYSENGLENSFTLFANIADSTLTPVFNGGLKQYNFRKHFEANNLSDHFIIRAYYSEAEKDTIWSESIHYELITGLNSVNFQLRTNPTRYFFYYTYNLPYETEFTLQGSKNGNEFRTLYSQKLLPPSGSVVQYQMDYEIRSFTQLNQFKYKLESETEETGFIDFKNAIISDCIFQSEIFESGFVFRVFNYFVEEKEDGGFILGFIPKGTCIADEFKLYKRTGTENEFIQSILHPNYYFELGPEFEYENKIFWVSVVVNGEESDFYKVIETDVIVPSNFGAN